MTLRTVTPVLMVAGARSNDLVAGADLSVTIATGDTFVITPVLNTYNLLIVCSFAGTTTLTFNAGSEPASMRSTMGANTAMNGVNAEVRIMVLDGGRYIQANSGGVATITGSNTGSNVKMAAYRIPRINS